MTTCPAKTDAASLTFDVVIATRNRPDALALTIPLILGQSRRPEALIVIDSSDDHAATAAAVAGAVGDWGGRVVVEHMAPGLPRQRNFGLRFVTADIVIFPDDDSLFHPGVSAAIMATYEADTDGCIAGVCAAETMTPPEGVLDASRYEMSDHHRREAAMRRWRNRLERRFNQLKPALYLGQLFNARRPRPDWMGEDYRLVEYMTGFRMSFRANVIRKVGFDEALTGYALDEDVDASLAVASQGLLVGALGARIYHHRFPGGRGDPYVLGVFTVLNRAYVVEKHIHDGALTRSEARTARARMRGFIRIKLLLALVEARNAAGRARLRGVWGAARAARALEGADRSNLTSLYGAAARRLVG